MGTIDTPDIEAIKARIRATWTAGDFGIIAHTIEEANEEVVSRSGLTPGMKVVDVACGTGNSAIPAAKRGADVVGVDIAPNLLEQARARAKTEGVTIRFEEGDAEKLAFPDASFDRVISIFGAMFGPRPDLVASEFKRVTRPGGKIVMGNWTPGGYIGQSFELASRYAPLPPGMPPPIQWGDEAIVRERFREGISDLQLNRRIAVFKYPFNEAETVAYYRKHSGPTIRTYERLDPAQQEDYRLDAIALWKKHNRATDGTILVESEFLEVIATRA